MMAISTTNSQPCGNRIVKLVGSSPYFRVMMYISGPTIAAEISRASPEAKNSRTNVEIDFSAFETNEKMIPSQTGMQANTIKTDSSFAASAKSLRVQFLKSLISG